MRKEANCRFLDVAEAELEAAIAYCETASSGLGMEFLAEVERTISRILNYPMAWRRLSENHRCCRTRRFPYGIIYSIDNDDIIISAVMHLRKDPDS